jgi:hypothetical protein
MEVKVFIEEEKGSLITQPEEWCQQVKELGLDGQTAFAGKAQVEGAAGVNPFPKMTKEMVSVYGLFLPDHEKIEAYRQDPIPLKALSAYGLAVREKWFVEHRNRVEIWHAFGKPDPIMVGILQDTDYSNAEYFLMAQWGPELTPYETMRTSVLADLCLEIKAKAKDALA